MAPSLRADRDMRAGRGLARPGWRRHVRRRRCGNRPDRHGWREPGYRRLRGDGAACIGGPLPHVHDLLGVILGVHAAHGGGPRTTEKVTARISKRASSRKCERHCTHTSARPSGAALMSDLLAAVRPRWMRGHQIAGFIARCVRSPGFRPRRGRPEAQGPRTSVRRLRDSLTLLAAGCDRLRVRRTRRGRLEAPRFAACVAPRRPLHALPRPQPALLILLGRRARAPRRPCRLTQWSRRTCPSLSRGRCEGRAARLWHRRSRCVVRGAEPPAPRQRRRGAHERGAARAGQPCRRRNPATYCILRRRRTCAASPAALRLPPSELAVCSLRTPSSATTCARC